MTLTGYVYPREHCGNELILVEAIGLSSTKNLQCIFPGRIKHTHTGIHGVLSHCKVVFYKLPKVVSINKVIFLCDFICTNKFLPVSPLFFSWLLNSYQKSIPFQEIKTWFRY